MMSHADKAVDTSLQAIHDALNLVRGRLARALGFGDHPESQYLGTLDGLIDIVKKEHEQLVAVRKVLL